MNALVITDFDNRFLADVAEMARNLAIWFSVGQHRLNHESRSPSVDRFFDVCSSFPSSS